MCFTTTTKMSFYLDADIMEVATGGKYVAVLISHICAQALIPKHPTNPTGTDQRQSRMGHEFTNLGKRNKVGLQYIVSYMAMLLLVLNTIL